MDDIIIIGGGFSGTLVAVHLLRGLPEGTSVRLLNRSEEPGPGVAYSTAEPSHLLNVRAANMSAFPDLPNHFEQWINAGRNERHGAVIVTAAGTFVSRSTFGSYLRDLLAKEVAASRSSFRVERNRATALHKSGGSFSVATTSGRSYTARFVVLATGNLADPAASTARIKRDPWSSDALDGIKPDQPVIIIGTGLTMVDLAVGLAEREVRAPLIAISRRGLVPHEHQPSSPRRPAIAEVQRVDALSRLLKQLRVDVERAQAHGGGWRDVVDGLRPHTQAIWQSLDQGARARFLRHARPWWDVHRHRIAPPTAEVLSRLRSTEQLAVVAGAVIGVHEADHCVEVRIRRRGSRGMTAYRGQRLIYATGVANLSDTNDPLIADLLHSGHAQADQSGLGLAVDDQLRVVDASGTADRSLFALGPLVRGTFWECTAVPDIRVHAQDVARDILQRF